MWFHLNRNNCGRFSRKDNILSNYIRNTFFRKLFVLIINDVTFSLAQETKSAPEQMVFSRSQRFGDWMMNCHALKSGKNETCSIKQELRTQKGAIVLSIRISKSKSSKNLVAEFILPLGVHIPSGAWLKTDIGSGKYRINLITGLQNGFRGEMTIDKKLQKLLRKGKKAFTSEHIDSKRRS